MSEIRYHYKHFVNNKEVIHIEIMIDKSQVEKVNNYVLPIMEKMAEDLGLKAGIEPYSKEPEK